MKKDKRTNNDLQNTSQKTNNDLQNTTQKTKDRAIQTPLKAGGELG